MGLGNKQRAMLPNERMVFRSSDSCPRKFGFCPRQRSQFSSESSQVPERFCLVLGLRPTESNRQLLRRPNRQSGDPFGQPQPHRQNGRQIHAQKWPLDPGVVGSTSNSGRRDADAMAIHRTSFQLATVIGIVEQCGGSDQFYSYFWWARFAPAAQLLLITTGFPSH